MIVKCDYQIDTEHLMDLPFNCVVGVSVLKITAGKLLWQLGLLWYLETENKNICDMYFIKLKKKEEINIFLAFI